MTRYLSFAAVCAALSVPAYAHDAADKARIDDHAPIGVMADHAHKKGEWMLSARAMTMSMNDPTNPMMGPQEMDMSMAMLGAMYAPSDKLTLAAMIGYHHKRMDMLMGSMASGMAGDGIGDARLTAIVPLARTAKSRLLASAGLMIPTGDDDDTSMMGVRLPLTMQAGSGTWAATPAVTYSYFGDGWSAGAQANATIWLDDNSYGEKPGDSVQLTSWASVTMMQDISLSGRLAYDHSAAWDGVASILGDTRESLTAYAGANIYLGTHRLGLEVGFPLTQDRGLNALKKSTSFLLGWQKAF
ncbi:transporter [Kordiimonas aestuarii]|uniref:transporter n=1 Tax=Kordiimonas aestuarii TaxID=1005925 RepID=UPI0021D0415D|nr:transporter [Kordiimonas aestuarii]